MKKLSIIIPVFNEKNTLLTILDQIHQVKIPNVLKEIILVDDCSKDGTRKILKKIENNHKIIYHKKNLGKGAAIRTALKHVTGEIVIIQDADLEYDPQDYKKLIKPILAGKSQVVYGSRALNKTNKPSYSMFFWGGRIVCKIANLLYGAKLSDVNCCYKVFETEVIKSINLKANRFEFCEEVTAKILRKKIKIKEVPVKYIPRTFKEGKKISWKDGFTAIKTLVKYRF